MRREDARRRYRLLADRLGRVFHLQRTVLATGTAQMITQVKSVLRRLHAAGAVSLFIFDASSSAAARTDEMGRARSS